MWDIYANTICSCVPTVHVGMYSKMSLMIMWCGLLWSGQTIQLSVASIDRPWLIDSTKI